MKTAFKISGRNLENLCKPNTDKTLSEATGISTEKITKLTADISEKAETSSQFIGLVLDDDRMDLTEKMVCAIIYAAEKGRDEGEKMAAAKVIVALSHATGIPIKSGYDEKTNNICVKVGGDEGDNKEETLSEEESPEPPKPKKKVSAETLKGYQ